MTNSTEEKQFGPFQYVRDFQRRLDESGWWHSFELPDGRIIEGSCDLAGLKKRLARFPIPEDLSGKRVLDIGAWDGWFTFEMERRGAEVVAIDVFDNPRFHQIHQILHSKAVYLQMDVYELDPRRIGKFDIVLFMGVLYHLKHPLLALERVCSVTDGFAAVDSFVLREGHRPGIEVEKRPIMEFYETDEFGGQTDNWVGPSLPCLLAFCRTAGFARVELQDVLEYSACVVCDRRWEPATSAKEQAPVLLTAFHHMNFGINFNSQKDDYLTCWFDYDGPVDLNTIKAQVGEYGVRPVRFGKIEDHWQVTFKCPPGLDQGWHRVLISIGSGPVSNAAEIAVDLKSEAISLSIDQASDGLTWKDNQINIQSGAPLALWVEGLPEAADRNNVYVIFAGIPSRVVYVEGRKPGRRQVNIELPGGDWVGKTVGVAVGSGGVESPPVLISCV